jgi:hypothetical protein
VLVFANRFAQSFDLLLNAPGHSPLRRSFH